MLRTSDIQCRPPDGHSFRPGARWRPPVTRDTWLRLAREIVLIAVFALLYEEIREHMVQAWAAAASHALAVVHAEQALGIFREQAVQAALIGSDNVTDAFNLYYGGTHFLVPIAILGWLLFRHPAHYGRARTALAVITGLAFIVFWLYPVAPPRLLPAHFGIIDTLVNPDGSGQAENALINSAGDQYASMPSLHVAWAVWSALAVYPVARHWALRALAVAYPLLTTLVVVATGNHFFLDAVAGAVLACVTWVAVTRVGARLSARAAIRRGYPAGFFLGQPERVRGGPFWPVPAWALASRSVLVRARAERVAPAGPGGQPGVSRR
jgi:hypothetical protein